MIMDMHGANYKEDFVINFEHSDQYLCDYAVARTFGIVWCTVELYFRCHLGSLSNMG